VTLDALDRPNSQIHGGSDGKVSPLKSSAPVLKKKREVSTTKAQRHKEHRTPTVPGGFRSRFQ
jgi:hypothetical protein